ncbi:MAG: MotA/TolQ/ExbB proton channel family protein [Candidatus Methylacidiphilales bacterium]
MFEGLIDFFVSGGFFMLPLALCSVVSVAFIVERGIALRRSEVIPSDLYGAMMRMRMGQDTTEIQQMAAPGSSTLARLVRICLEHLPWSKAENVEAVQTQARTEISKLERGLVVLEITTGVAPLLGLLGTASGLITVFANIGEVGLDNQGMIIARGIAEALNTTVAGLVIAIPSLIAHSYYSKKIEAMAVEMESLCMDFLTKCYLNSGEATPDS